MSFSSEALELRVVHIAGLPNLLVRQRLHPLRRRLLLRILLLQLCGAATTADDVVASASLLLRRVCTQELAWGAMVGSRAVDLACLRPLLHGCTRPVSVRKGRLLLA
uniref:Uncharacterized protein n=1 Tax=Triticum urartu TaxID=4572 RepID=A0A8R7UGR2_TRIUA